MFQRICNAASQHKPERLSSTTPVNIDQHHIANTPPPTDSRVFGAAGCSAWRRFWFESNQFFGWIENMDDWKRLRQAYPEKTDAVLLAAKEATYKGNLSQQERDARPNFGLRWEHDGERTLRDFFAENGMRISSDD